MKVCHAPCLPGIRDTAGTVRERASSLAMKLFYRCGEIRLQTMEFIHGIFPLSELLPLAKTLNETGFKFLAKGRNAGYGRESS